MTSGTFYHLPLCKCDLTGKFTANGTKIEIRKLIKDLCHDVTKHTEISQHAVQT